MKKIALLSLAASTVIMANGYKIPEQSVNSVALAGADVANVHGADAAYSNPANMAFMDDGQYMEGTLTYIHLTSIDYDGSIASLTPGTGVPRQVDASASSKKENFLLPSLHYVSEAYGNFRFGASLTVPAGLSKRWHEEGPSKLIAEEFTLKVIELNPVVSYKVADNLSIAAGLRMVYSEGVVKSSGNLVADLSLAGGSTGDVVYVERDMTGDSLEFGYNLAVAYKPVEELSLAMTYRSEVDLAEEGNAQLDSTVVAGFGAIPTGTSLGSYNGPASVTIPLPAVLALAGAYTFNEQTTVEVVYERTFWDSYESLDFGDYSPALSGVLQAAYDNPKPRNWSDTNTYRLGVTHKFNKKWTGMAGYAYDESPAPQSTVSFELPESDAHIFSLGARYYYNDELSIGIAGLYDKKDSIDVSQTTSTSATPLNGTFSNVSAYLISLGVGYKF